MKAIMKVQLNLKQIDMISTDSGFRNEQKVWGGNAHKAQGVLECSGAPETTSIPHKAVHNGKRGWFVPASAFAVSD